MKKKKKTQKLITSTPIDTIVSHNVVSNVSLFYEHLHHKNHYALKKNFKRQKIIQMLLVLDGQTSC